MNNVLHYAPQTLAEALSLLAENPQARVLAGGTDLIARWKKSDRADLTLVSLRRIDELARIEADEDGLFIGAAVTMDRLMEPGPVRSTYPALAQAAGQVGSVQIRNLATIGGNAVNAAPSADTVPPLIIYRAEAVIASGQAERRCPLEDFFTGPGRTVLQPGEILKGFRLPPQAAGSAAAFVKHSRRAGMDLATVGAALGLSVAADGFSLSSLRLVLGAVGPTPILVRGLSVVGRSLKSAAALSELIGEQAVLEARPITDVRGSRDYRLAMVRETARACFETAIEGLAQPARGV